MTDGDASINVEQLLAGLDFAREAERAKSAHQQEVERLLKGFLEVMDSLEAFCAHPSPPTEDGALTRAKTVDRIRRQALRVLEEAGVTPIDCLGKAVDLTSSEVVGVRSSPDEEEDIVIEEIVRGYSWRGRLLRRARVTIAANHHGPSRDGTEGDSVKGDEQQ
jgi:molecular chaperone GrpE